MSKSTLVLAATVVLLSTSIEAQSGRLTPPLASVSLGTDFANKPVPVWSNGVFLAHDSAEVALPMFEVFDRAGVRILGVPFRIPEASQVHLLGLARSSGGQFAVSGSAARSGSGADFIAWLGASGGITKVVRTSPFAVYKLAFAPDGTLWALGREVDPSLRTRAEQRNGEILRHYSPDGRLLGSGLPGERLDSVTVDSSFLFVSDSLVSVFSQTSSQWIEASQSGDVVGRWNIERLPLDRTITGAALTSGGLYVSVQHPAEGSSPQPVIYRLEKSAGRWIPVDAFAASSSKVNAMIMGSDHDQLVMTVGLPHIVWTKEQ